MTEAKHSPLTAPTPIDDETAADNAALIAAVPKLVEALDRLVNARALAEVRSLVAGWNGEGRKDGPFKERHPPLLGATLPKTNCGAIYELDTAMQAGRALVGAALASIGRKG